MDNQKQDFSDHISVIVKNRDGVLVDEQAKALTSTNDQGVFDILPEHANFISIVKDFIIIHPKIGQPKEIKIKKGVLRTYENTVRVYLELLNETPPASEQSASKK